MGRYVYSPLLTNYNPLDEEKYIKDYVKSIKSGELLVDLSNYDLYITEEGVELPIPTTRILKNKVINFINSLNFEERKELFNRNLEKIEKMKNNSKELMSSSEALYSEYEQTKRFLNDKLIYFKTINENNINYLGELKKPSLLTSSFPGDSYLIYYKLRLNELYDNFNEIISEQRSNFNFSSHSYKGNGNKSLYNIYTEITNLYTELSKKLEYIGTGSGLLVYDKTVIYKKNETTFRSFYQNQPVSIKTKVYDIGYLTLAWRDNNQHDIITRCKLADTIFESSSYTENQYWDFSENETKRYKILSNENIGSFTNIEGWCYERLWFDGGLYNLPSETEEEFTSFNKNAIDSEGYFYPFYPDRVNNNGRPLPYRETYGNQHWRSYNDGDININPKMREYISTYNPSTDIWIPNEVNSDGTITTNNNKFITNIPKNYIAFKNNGIDYSKFASLSFGIENSVAHNTNQNYDTAGYYNCWRMIKVIYSKEINKTINQTTKVTEPVTEETTYDITRKKYVGLPIKDPNNPTFYYLNN